MQYLTEIIRRTPLYVFGILAGLIILGVQQMRERRVSRGRLLILPLVMVAFSVFGIALSFGWNPIALASWAAGLGIALLANEFIRAPRGVRAVAAEGPFVVPGSWVPLALMMVIFFSRYAFAVMLAMRPERGASTVFVAASAGSLGLCSGIFAARAARIWRTKAGAVPA